MLYNSTLLMYTFCTIALSISSIYSVGCPPRSRTRDDCHIDNLLSTLPLFLFLQSHVVCMSTSSDLNTVCEPVNLLLGMVQLLISKYATRSKKFNVVFPLLLIRQMFHTGTTIVTTFAATTATTNTTHRLLPLVALPHNLLATSAAPLLTS